MSAAERFREGVAHARAGDFEAAAAAYRGALELDPKHRDAGLFLGEVLRRLERNEEAVAVFEAALPLAEGDPTRLHRLGASLHAVGSLKAAERAQRAALALDPKLIPPRLALAALLQARRAYADGLQTLRDAEALEPENAVVQQRLGIFLQAVGDFTAAEAAHRRSTELAPTNLTMQRQFAAVLYRLGREDEAREAYARARELGAEQLPASVIAALTDLESGGTRRPGGPKPSRAARQLLPSRAKWDPERIFRWGRVAQDYTRTAMFLQPDSVDEVERLVDAPDWQALAERLNGRGAVFVDTHVGLPHVSIARLVRSPFPAKIVNANGEALLSLPPDAAVNARASDNHLAIVRLLPFIRNGGIVFTAGDGGVGQRLRRQLGAHSLSLAIGPPTLAFAAKCPIFWSATLWKKRRIEVQLIEGPLVEPGEKLQDYQLRWTEFYAARLEAALTSGPENVDKRQFDAIYGSKG